MMPRPCPDAVGLQTGQRAGLLINTEANQVGRKLASGVQEMPGRIEAEGTRDWIDLGPARGAQRTSCLVDGK